MMKDIKEINIFVIKNLLTNELITKQSMITFFYENHIRINKGSKNYMIKQFLRYLNEKSCYQIENLIFKLEDFLESLELLNKITKSNLVILNKKSYKYFYDKINHIKK